MQIYIHSKCSLKRNVLKFILVLIPLYAYAIFKNGFLLYGKNFIGFLEIFKVLYLLVLGIVAYLLKTIICKKKAKIDLEFLSLFIIPIFLPISINYVIYFIGMLLGLIITEILSKYFNFNKIAFIKLVIILLTLIFGTYNYLNPAEEASIYSFNLLDLLFGRNIGGIGSTSIILGFIIMIILQFTNDYKFLIPVAGLLSYLALGMIFDNTILLNGSNILALILVCPDSISSPIKSMSKVIYGLSIGVLSVIFSILISPFEGVFISILFCSIIYEIICKISKKVL